MITAVSWFLISDFRTEKRNNRKRVIETSTFTMKRSEGITRNG